MNELQKQLFTLQDPSYLEFHSKLIPTIEKNRIIGIRTPALRSFAKNFKGTKEAKAFLKAAISPRFAIRIFENINRNCMRKF